MSGNNVTGTKRRSRFDVVEIEPEPKKLAVDMSAAAARAAELSKELSNKVKHLYEVIMSYQCTNNCLLSIL